MKKQEENKICPYCEKDDTHKISFPKIGIPIKKGDYGCNNCGEHFNIFSKYIEKPFDNKTCPDCRNEFSRNELINDEDTCYHCQKGN